MTELEYRKAVETGKDCLIFLLHEDALWPVNFVDKGRDAEKIAALRDEFSAKFIVSFFESTDVLSGLIGAAIHQWETHNRNSALEEGMIAELDLNRRKFCAHVLFLQTYFFVQAYFSTHASYLITFLTILY